MNAAQRHSVQEPRLQVVPQAGQPLLELQNIQKFFGKTHALKGVNITINPGEVHAVVGENGAGKSTLISIAAGVLPATSGQILVDGKPVDEIDAVSMRRLGIAVAYQHPALPQDLTVQECLCLVDNKYQGRAGRERVQVLLDRCCTPELRVYPGQRVADLALAQRHVVEIARALSSDPDVLILDEPTEPFQEPEVERLFALIRSLRDSGKAIIYISHRLHEVGEIADRISVLRDGDLIETRKASQFSHDDIIRFIVGRPLGQVFPDKSKVSASAAPILSARGLSGHGFHHVNLDIRPGEIVGLAGVDGQGQREFMRALAGAAAVTHGNVTLSGQAISMSSRASVRETGIGYVPDDRHKEGLFMSMSVLENIGLGILDKTARSGVISNESEKRLVDAPVDSLSVKTASLASPVSSLSGGNQQKVLIGREIAAEPKVLLIDEPTVGVDIGSKSEIYFQLRALAKSGVAIVICSSDGVEVEGLCDRVLVFARGKVSCELTGSDVTDEAITAANLQATGRRQAAAKEHKISTIQKVLSSHYFPALVLTILSTIICGTTAVINDSFLSEYNLGIVMTFLSGLAFISFAQLCVMLMGEIDLSVGPLAGLAVVMASFWIPDGASTGQVLIGAGAILLACTVTGLIQGIAVALLNLPAVVVTLATFFGLQGLALLLRPSPSGTISETLSIILGEQYLVFPVSALLMLVVLVALERGLFHTFTGRALRATGSNRQASLKLGVKHRHMGILAFALSGLLTGLGGLILAAQVGIGSATVGAEYTLMSITAVVLGGTAIAGGRGSFVATFFGALLVQATFSTASFLNIGSEWQYWLVGATTLLAATIYQNVHKTA